MTEIEAAIERLPPENIQQLKAWLEHRSVNRVGRVSEPSKSITGAGLLAAVRASDSLPENILSALEAVQEADLPPADKWRE